MGYTFTRDTCPGRKMNTLLERFKTKTALAKALQVTRPAVVKAFRIGVVPSTWVPKLLKQGLSQEEIAALPLAERASNILLALKHQS